MLKLMLVALCVMVTYSSAMAVGRTREEDTYMSEMIVRILAQIRAEKLGAGPNRYDHWKNRKARPDTPVEPRGPFPKLRTPPVGAGVMPTGAVHMPRTRVGGPAYYSESHEHHVNEGHLTGPHYHQDRDSLESHQQYLDAQDRADGKPVPARPLHRKTPSFYPNQPDAWTSSHEHHVNEGNVMPDHRHFDYDSQQSHEMFQRRQALVDGKPLPAMKAAPTFLSGILGPVLTPINYQHAKHTHWYNAKAHWSSSHEHHVNEGNEMRRHRHNSRESMEQHKIFVEQQKLANDDITLAPPSMGQVQHGFYRTHGDSSPDMSSNLGHRRGGPYARKY